MYTIGKDVIDIQKEIFMTCLLEETTVIKATHIYFRYSHLVALQKQKKRNILLSSVFFCKQMEPPLNSYAFNHTLMEAKSISLKSQTIQPFSWAVKVCFILNHLSNLNLSKSI